jgi:hypothetical protein
MFGSTEDLFGEFWMMKFMLVALLQKPRRDNKKRFIAQFTKPTVSVAKKAGFYEKTF